MDYAESRQPVDVTIPIPHLKVQAGKTDVGNSMEFGAEQLAKEGWVLGNKFVIEYTRKTTR
jgi:hypothetical protein